MVIIVAIPTGLDGHNGYQINFDFILLVIIRTHFLSFCIYMCILIMSGGVSYCPHDFEGELLF